VIVNCPGNSRLRSAVSSAIKTYCFRRVVVTAMEMKAIGKSGTMLTMENAEAEMARKLVSCTISR